MTDLLRKSSDDMMSYKEWFEQHAHKHKKIVDKLVAKGYSEDKIIEYFDFDNMVKEENDFCPLYKDNKKCHDMKNLNCYLCACPHFRFDDKGIEEKGSKTLYSFCEIESKNGKEITYEQSIHQDCSDCSVPHTKAYVKKNFDLDWKNIMRDCRA